MAATFDRKNARQKLYTGRTKMANDRGGHPVLEPELLALWPQYLSNEIAAARPAIFLPDVENMLQQ